MVLDTTLSPTTFGEDAAGELYVGDDGSGRIYELVDPRPFCAVAMSQASYSAGETVTASSFRLVNLGTAGVPVRSQLVVVRPSGAPIVLRDNSFALPADTETDRGPIPIVPVGANTPPGNYTLNCRLTNTTTGNIISRGQATFEIL